MKLDWATQHFADYNELYSLYHNYYVGEHEMYYGEIVRYPKLSSLIHGIRANICKTVVDVFCSRLELIGINTDNEDNNILIEEFFKSNRITSIAKAIHKDVSIYGDGYISIWKGKDGKVRFYNENPVNTAVHYDAEDNIDMALKYKTYTDLDNKRKTKIWVYTKDMICEFVKDNHILAFENLKNGVSYKNDLGIVPIFHFYNGIRQNDFCKSDLHEVIPLQRSLNKTLQDRAISCELNASKQKYATNISYQVDEEGRAIDPFKGMDFSKMLMTSEDVKFGEFSATDLTNYTNVIDSIHNEIACVSRIPMHLFNLTGGSFPSGEALKTAEAPLLAKISDKEMILGDVWEDVFKTYLTLNGKEANVLEAIWKDTQPHNQLEQWQIAGLKTSFGVSNEQILKEQGYSQDEISKFKENEYNPYKNIGGNE